MPNIDGEITELELENKLIEQLCIQFHSSDMEDAYKYKAEIYLNGELLSHNF